MTTPTTELAETLRHCIGDGTFSPGGMLPTLAELAARYRVTASVAQRATGLLQAEGLVERRHGGACRGTRLYVAGPASAQAA